MYENLDAEKRKRFARIIAMAWADENYKKRLMGDPVALLKEEGIDLPAGMSLRVVEDTPNLRSIVLPPPPKEGEIVDLEERAAAASCCVCTCG